MRPGLPKIVAIQFGHALSGSWWTVVAGSCLGAASALVLLSVVPQRFEAAAAAPHRAPLVALGVLAGCLLFVGPLLTRRFLDPVIHCAEGVRSLSGVPLLARVPRIPTPGLDRERARRWLKNGVLSALSVAALVAALVTLG